MAFKSLGLSPEVLRGVQAAGYSEPTPIQLRAIPVLLEGRDVIGSAQTGTGKTAAFALPIITKLQTHGKLRCLALVPTRELAAQVETSFRDFARFTNLRTVCVFGGVGYGQQRQDLQRGADIVVAPPGRLLDFLQQKTLHLRDINTLVLDEVDRMLDMGFLPDVCQNQAGYAQQVTQALRQAGIRALSDLSNNKINYKIREHSLQKLPYQVVVGDKEMEAGLVSVRARGNQDLGQLGLDDLIARLKAETLARQ